MKVLKKLIILASMSILSLSSFSANAANLNLNGLDVNYSPQRPGISYILENNVADLMNLYCDGNPDNDPVTRDLNRHEGLAYPSFNNFINNPRVCTQRIQEGNVVTRGDERAFLTAGKCQDDDCELGEIEYGNVVPENISPGEKVSMHVYFHNNGSDPHDDGAPNSPNAKNVKIGIDLNNAQVQGTPRLFRPQAFIYADNQEFRTDPSDPSTQIKVNGQTLRTATDDVQVALDLTTAEAENASLKIVPGRVKLVMNNADGEPALIDFTDLNSNSTTIRIATESDGIIEVEATIKWDEDANKIWIEFDELPGCFTYSGSIYFEAELETPEQNFCESISAQLNPAPITIDNREAYEIEIDSSNIGLTAEQYENNNVRYKFTSTNPNGEFWSRSGFVPNRVNRGEGEVRLGIFDLQDIAYIGEPGDRITITVEGDDIIGPNSQCSDAVVLSDEAICLDLNLVDQVTSYRLPSDQDQIVRVLRIDEITFEDGKEIPEDARLAWRSDNPDGEFYDSFQALANGEALDKNLLGWAITDLDQISIIYLGPGTTISVGVVPEERSGNNCADSVSLEAFCVDLLVNNNDPVLAGFVSRFEAQAFDQNGAPYEGGGIDYSVDDPRFGEFSDNLPAGGVQSPSPFVNRIRAFIQRQAVENAVQNGDLPAWYVRALEQSGAFSINELLPYTSHAAIFFNALQGSNGQNVIHVRQLDPNGNPIAQCSADFPIEAPVIPDLVCESLEATITDRDGNIIPANQNLEMNTTYTINAQANYNNEDQGNIVNPEARISYQIGSEEEGVFLRNVSAGVINGIQNRQNQGQLRTPEQLREFLVNVGLNPDNVVLGDSTESANPGDRIVFVALGGIGPESRLTINTIGEENPACMLEKTFVPNVGICVDLNSNIRNSNNQAVQSLKSNSAYTIIAESEFRNIQPAGNLVQFSINDPEFATIVDTTQLNGTRYEFRDAAEALDAISREALEALVVEFGGNPDNVLLNTITVEAASPVSVVTFDNRAPVQFNILRIEQLAENLTIGLENCVDEIPFMPETDDDEDLICVDINANIEQVFADILAVNNRQAVNQLSRNGIFQLSAQSEFDRGQPQTDQIRISMDPAYGAILNPAHPAAQDPARTDAFIRSIALLQEGPLFDNATLAQINNNDPEVEELIVQETVVAPGTTITVVTYSNAPAAAANPLLIEQIDPNNEGIAGLENCRLEVPILEEAPICVALNETITNLHTNEDSRAAIEPENIYRLRALPRLSNGDLTQIRYQIDPEVGIFLNAEIDLIADFDFNFLSAPIQAIDGLRRQHNLTEANLEAILADSLPPQMDILVNDLTVDADQTVILITYSNIAEPDPDALQITAVNQDGTQYNNPECDINVPLEIPELICIDLNLGRADGQAFDPNREVTSMTINAEQFPSNRNIFVRTTGPCLLSKNANAPAAGRANEIVFTPEEIRAVQGGNLNFTVFCQDYDPNSDRVTITADGGANCSDQIIVEPQPLECVDLEITTPDTPWRIDEGDRRQNVIIDVTTNPPGLADDLYYHWEVDGAEWSNGSEKISARGDFSQTVEELDQLRDGDDVRVSVYASSDAAGNNAFNACSDSIRGTFDKEDDEESDIVKVVYPLGDTSRADDLINIGHTIDYVSYMAVFRPGDNVKSVKIKDESFRGGAIQARGYGGRLTYKGMQIIVEYSGNRDSEIIFREGSYDADEQELRDKSRGDLRDENNDHDCDQVRADVCVEDSENAAGAFRNGDEIEINNISSSVSRILVKYQVSTKDSGIDERTCENLDASTGCGSEFRNEISFRDNKGNSGDDRASVNILCPYVLSRQGGDLLFYEIINSGADISQCAPVKGSTGVGIRITQLPQQTNPNSGADEEAPELPVLDLPSHDICRFSNTDQGIEGYSNALENFSSSVCELQATVAEELYEENINQAVIANLTRIARWEGNLTLPSINNVNQLETLRNASRGVFVKRDGDLTIDDDFILQASGDVPAAQTYIIENGNLIINGNISYGGDLSDPRNISSAAFIVLNGNIQIDKNVKNLDGIYMALNPEKADDKGQIISAGGRSETPLTVNGSLIGNVFDLFTNRVAVGDPRYDQGSVTVKYDERLLLNTPPGISDLVNIQQALVPN